MIEFNELQISPKCDTLHIDVSVLEESYYENVYIDSIFIDTQDTYVGSGPSSSPVYTYTSETDEKRVVLDLTKIDFLNLNGSVKDNMFFIYVVLKGTPAPDTPCGKDNAVCIGVVINTYGFYQRAMYYIKEVENSCAIPKRFIDFLLQFKALELSVRTGNYPLAIRYWNKFFKYNLDSDIDIKLNHCGCN